ncbi:hypothetical protein DYB26_002837, partial [Aphanomyces astaci]
AVPVEGLHSMALSLTLHEDATYSNLPLHANRSLTHEKDITAPPCHFERKKEWQSVGLSISHMKKAATKRLVYVVAGEASGDAIGGKLIRALNRRHADGPFQFRGVGGYRHHDHVVEDIRQSQPDAVVTIDSKGFCFRVLKSLQGITNRMDHRRPAIVHYVAPSIWAFKHKHRNAASTAQSLGLFIDHMLVLLPFEARLFNHYRTWTTFVGHPSVETFMDAHDLFRRHDLLSSVVPPSITTELESLSMTSEWLQPEAPALWPMQTAIVHARRHHPRQRRTDEFAIAALVGRYGRRHPPVYLLRHGSLFG